MAGQNFQPVTPEREADDAVWTLLSASPQPAPDGWFTVRALARCRLAGHRAEGRLPSLERVWRWALAGGVAVAVGCALLSPLHRAHHQVVAVSQKKSVQEAFAILASMQPENDPNGNTTSWQDSTF